MSGPAIGVAAAAFVLGWFVGSRVGGADVSDLFTVLISLMGGEASATEIYESMHDCGSEIRLGNVYPLLRWLERKGVVISREVPGGPERGGRPRRLYCMPGLRTKPAPTPEPTP